ncbi:MAG: FAD-binding oxidoreductase [Deltaproteobacteria bacterium]|nr:FAD-binding oxidoreductase [Deltaproteobacteria bacterium]
MSELPSQIDVAIIGGGFAGCATAWALRRRGVDSIVLEREPALGRFASGRGAGLGRQLAEDDAITALTIRGAALLRSELATAWRPTGGILTFDDATAVDAYVARARRHGLDATVIDRTAVLAHWPQLERLSIVAGLAVPSDGVIDIRSLLARYADGAHVALGAGVERIEAGGAGARVVTARGSIEARVVVDASGAWAGAITGDPPLEAYRRHLFVLEADARADAPYLWHLGSDELYVRADEGGILTSACDATLGRPCDAQTDPDGERNMRAVLANNAPALARAKIERQWACQRSFTPDRTMRLGRDPQRPWLVWAAGLGGHGATASPAVGEVVADAVLAAR